MAYYFAVKLGVSELRALLSRLDGEPADALESQTLEFKSWNPDPKRFKEQIRDLRESVVCFANASGGQIVVGVTDRKRTRRDAIQGVGSLDPTQVQKCVWDGTAPSITVDVFPVDVPEGRVLVLDVPRGVTVCTTSEGTAKRRVGKDCQPLGGPALVELVRDRGPWDMTSVAAPEAGLEDLDPHWIDEFRRMAASDGRRPELANLSPAECLEAVGLLHERDVTLAAILLLGTPRALARWASTHEVIFIHYRSQTQYDVRHDLGGPILADLRRIRSLLESHVKMEPFPGEGFAEQFAPDITWYVAREAVLNALVHRDYFLRQSIHVEIRPRGIEISSPGGFIGGVTPENILRHAPVRRNPLLAEAAQAAGLVDRTGLGVDRIYKELLELGKPMPRYESDASGVRLNIPTTTHRPFATFVAAERRGGRELDLDDLIVLRAVSDQGEVDRWAAARSLQRTEEEAARRLVALRERGYLKPDGRGKGTSYRLARSHSDLLRGRAETDSEFPLDRDAVRLRIQAVIRERGRLTNAEIRAFSDLSRTEVVRLMRGLAKEGLVQVEGRGRGAGYVAGPRFPPKEPKPGKRRRG